MSFLSRTPATRGRSSGRRTSGFTILEVAIAAFVMTVTISGSIVVLQTGFKALDNARNTTLASQIIQSEMERIRLLAWNPSDPSDPNAKSVSTLRSEGITLSTIFPSDTLTTTMAGRFTATRKVDDVFGKAGEMKSITITVTWKGLDGITHSRSSTGYYCKDGLYDYYYTLA